MARNFEQRLADLQAAVRDPTTAAARKLITQALRGNNGMFVAIACGAIGDGAGEFAPAWIDALPAAFERLVHDGVKRDPACPGKTAIAKWLRDRDVGAEEVLLAGVRTIQREPVWGTSVDTAAELRGICVMGLVERQHPRAWIEAAHLLADPEAVARRAAARAIGSSGNAEIGEPLLRLRIQLQERDPDVLCDAFGALLELAPEPSLDFVADYLDGDDDEVAHAAAIALGESRLDAARERLITRIDASIGTGPIEAMLMALATLRSDAAWSYLLTVIEDRSQAVARHALRALSTFRHDERLRSRVEAAVAARTDGALGDEFAQRFADDDDE